MERKYYIDNIRWIFILTLIPFHSAMAWNTWESNYIWFHGNKILSSFVISISSFYMPVMFVLAGMSLHFSLKKRTVKRVLVERVKKLLLPCISGIMIVVTVMTYFAAKYHLQEQKSFLAHSKSFFTHLTDFTGYDGNFTPAHLWFLLFLFIDSLLMLLIICVRKKVFPNQLVKEIPMCILLLLGVVPMICTPVLNFDKSIGESFSLVFLGYYVFSREDVIEKLKKYAWLCMGITIVISMIYVILFVWMEQQDIILVKVCHHVAKWFGILAFLGVGSRYLNGSNRFTRYMSANSFPIYIFHFLWIVVIQYYAGQCIANTILLYVVSVVGALGLTILTIEMIKRIPGIRFLFAMKGGD